MVKMSTEEIKRRWLKAESYTIRKLYYGFLVARNCLPSVKDVMENVKMISIFLRKGEE